jgi:membrane protein
VRGLVDRARRYVSGILTSYSRHAGSQLAAAIAYRVLFSFVPFLALLVTIVDVVLPQSRREQFIDWLSAEVGGTGLEDSVERALTGSGSSAPIVALVALVTLLWGASGMMASIRIAFRLIWNRDSGLTYARSKLRDFALVGFVGALVVCAFGLSLLVSVVVETGSALSRSLGLSGIPTVLSTAADVGVSTLVVFAALLALYRFVPPVTEPLRLLWPSAVAAAVAFEVCVHGYAVYTTRFADFNSVYGPIGAVLAFLLLVYLLAAIVLLGAETAAARRSPHGDSAPDG